MAAVGFTPENAKRIAQAVRYVEQSSRGGSALPRSRTVFNPGSVVAKNGGSTIAAMGGSTPGSGTVTLYTFDGTTLAADATVTAFNVGSAAIAANAWLILSYVGGYWFVVVEVCS